jgi:hypothetical protein
MSCHMHVSLTVQHCFSMLIGTEGRQCSLPASMAASSTDEVSCCVQVILVTRRAEGRDLWFKSDQPW